MFRNLFFILVIYGLFGNIQTQTNKDKNSNEIAANNNNIFKGRGLTALPKFILQIMTKSVKNIFQNLKNILQRFEKYAISMLGDTLGFLARSDNTAVSRRRRSPWLDASQQGEKQKSGGVISKVSSLFMMPFKLAFGTVKWVPGAIINRSTKLGLAVAADVVKSPIFQSMAHAAVVTTEKIAEESWNFAKVNVFPKLDKLATSMKESHSLPNSISTIITEMQTLYHLYRFLGLA